MRLLLAILLIIATLICGCVYPKREDATTEDIIEDSIMHYLAPLMAGAPQKGVEIEETSEFFPGATLDDVRIDSLVRVSRNELVMAWQQHPSDPTITMYDSLWKLRNAADTTVKNLYFCIAHLKLRYRDYSFGRREYFFLDTGFHVVGTKRIFQL